MSESKIGAFAHATAGGTFAITFPNVHAGGCMGAVYLRATGSLGSLAILKMPPRLCAVRTP